MAAIKLRIVVEELDNVLTQFDQVKVYRSTTGMGGTYSEITGPGTRIVLVAGQCLYEWIDSAGDVSYWYRFAYYNSVSTAEGSQSEPISGEDTGGLYCSIQDLRDEGITLAMLSDSNALRRIRIASAYIERVTGRWFEQRNRTLPVKGRGTHVLWLGHPIIKVDAVSIVSGRGANMTRHSIDTDDLLVFNRHLTKGLTNPDDRDNPRIEFHGATGVEYPGDLFGKFPSGPQVVEVVGVFGYTELGPGDPVGETSDGSQVPLCYGDTPELIKHACKLIVVREIGLLGEAAKRSAWMHGWRLESEKTADQSYKLTPVSSLALTGAATGDPEIDGILMSYLAPPCMGVV